MVAAGACQRFRCLKAMENCRAWTTSLRHRSVEGPPSVNRLVKSWVLRIDGSSPEGEEYLSLGREPWFERLHSPLCGPTLPPARCGKSLGAMAASGQFVDDGTCD